MAEEFHLNGHDTPEALEETESQEVLNGAFKRLSDLSRGDGVLTSMTKADMSLLKSLACSPPNTEDRFTQALRNANFTDEKEMQKHIRAYAEAIRLGMDTELNIQMVEGLRGTNRKNGFKSNLIGSLLDSLSHQKYTANVPRADKGSNNPRSPLG